MRAALGGRLPEEVSPASRRASGEYVRGVAQGYAVRSRNRLRTALVPLALEHVDERHALSLDLVNDLAGLSEAAVARGRDEDLRLAFFDPLEARSDAQLTLVIVDLPIGVTHADFHGPAILARRHVLGDPRESFTVGSSPVVGLEA